jgi:hypothetical protein
VDLLQWDRAERQRKCGLSAVGQSREIEEMWTYCSGTEQRDTGSVDLVQWDRAERQRKCGLSAVGQSRETEEMT